MHISLITVISIIARIRFLLFNLEKLGIALRSHRVFVFELRNKRLHWTHMWMSLCDYSRTPFVHDNPIASVIQSLRSIPTCEFRKEELKLRKLQSSTFVHLSVSLSIAPSSVHLYLHTYFYGKQMLVYIPYKNTSLYNWIQVWVLIFGTGN